MSTTLKVLSAKKVIASHQINQGDTLVIDARNKSNYQLIDDQTGFAPQNIIAKREGKDLKIFLEDGDMNPDVVIKGYYGDENSEEVTNLLVGQHENGGVYAYVPESGLKADAVSMLAEEVAAPQALGGEDLASAFWAFNPWWLLALVPLAAGIAIAASSGGSSGGSSNNGNNDTTADKPGIKANNDGSITVTPGSDNTKVNVTFKDENGKDKTVTAEKGADGKWSIPDAGDTGATIDPDTGAVTIPSENIKDGSTVTATGTDDKGNTATNTGTVADSKPGDSNGDGVVDDKDDSTEIVTLPNGKEVPRNTDGAPNIVFGEDANNDGYINAKEIIGKDGKDTTPVYITIPEKTEVGDTLVVTVNGKEQKIPVTEEMVNKGYTTVPVPITQDGEIKVTAKVVDPVGNESATGDETVTVDSTIPPAPTLTPEDNGSIIVGLPDETKPGDIVEVKVVPEGSTDPITVTLTKNEDGTWTSNNPDVVPSTTVDNPNSTVIPADKVEDGSEVKAVSKDPSGNESEEVTATAGNDKEPVDSKPGDSNGDGVVDDKDDSTEIVTLPNGKEEPRNTDGAPNIVFGEDANDDGYINAKEIIGKDGKDTTPVYITIPEKTEVGDTLVVTINDKEKSIPVTPEMIEKGFTQVDVPVNGDGPIEVTAKVTDPAGQSSNEGNKKVEVDTGVPGDTDGNGTPEKGDNSKEQIDVPIIDKDGNETPIKVDKNNNGAPNIIFVEDRDGNNVLNKTEVGDDNSTPVHITVPDKTEAGDTLVVTINGKEEQIPVTEEMVNKGYTTIPVPITQDGEIKVTAKVVDPAGNESATGEEAVTVDTSDPTAPKDAGVDNTNGDGVVSTTPANEGDSITTTVKLTNNNGNKKLPFSLPNGTADGELGESDFADKSEFIFSNGVKLNPDGTLNVPAGVTEFTITTPVKEDNTAEGEEKGKFTVGGVPGNEVTVNDAMTPEIAKIDASSLKAKDDLTDETANAESYYPNNDSTPYVGEIGKADVSDFDKSVGLATGLTNDTTPSLEFSLDKALAANQQLVVTRYIIANGTRASSEDLSTKLGDTKGKTAFSFTDDELAQTYGTEYEYEVKVLTDGVATSTATHAIRLDTIVEAMKVKTFNVAKDGTATLIFEASNNSEVNAKIKVTYPQLSGGMGEANAVANDDGTYTLSLTDFNRKNPQGIEMTVVDGAGNINTNKVIAIRNLFTLLTTEEGPNTNHKGFDDSLVSLGPDGEQSRNTADKSGGGLTMSDGNDTLIIGLDNFGGFGVDNGSIGDAQTYAVIGAKGFNLDTGAGDDFVYVRGTAQNLGTNNKISMGEGNDKLTFAKELAFGSMNVNMGEGNNIMEVLGELGIAQAGTRDFTFGDGNDSMFVSSNFDGSKAVNFGNGYNKLHVGGDLTGSGTVTFGEGDDILLVGKGMGAARALGDKNEINMGAGDDYLEVSGTSYRGLINMGEGNDKVKLAKLYDDSAHATHQYDGGTNSDGSAENDVLVLSAEDSYHVLFFKNFETVDLTAASKQTLTLTIDGLTRDNTKSIDILGGAEDKVELSGKGWAQTGQSKQVDGQTLYEYTNSGVSDEHIWIQSGIQVTL